ncbi:hypothetical protein KP79_PYT22712 [Mizuhopecten yessoensis]|uniref:Mutator-like transposase domain-containing protein n=1 Tax=Mizuhopecten yessoensis TaxID=6573 RepID=A0A210PWR1_MIZYE|nr:hypothetical protein KP79_PYT22712 [Mizuhopecten yessoensis]
MVAVRDLSGRFKRLASKIRPVKKLQVLIDHNYSGGHFCKGEGSCENDDWHLFNNIKLGKHAERSVWKDGRRIVEFDVLLSNLSSCQSCKLEPIPLTSLNIVGEFRKGLSGSLYVKCQNPDCGAVNKATYGKTHHIKLNGMPCFVVNTKLGTSMIDCVGGRDNNFLSTLNIKPINSRSLRAMENRAGGYVEAVSKTSTKMAAKESFQMEMEDIAKQESLEAQKSMGESICVLGVTPLPDASPSVGVEGSWYPLLEV